MTDNNTHPARWMIYGANGYTGELIARAAVKQGLRPLLAGRSPEKVQKLAQELGTDAVAFSLDNATQAAAAINGCSIVLNCAGPFSATAEPMMKACLQAKSHYLDITGEIAVFELAQSLHQQAKTAGIVICPGVGFDVIPTDCVAAALKAALPDATHLALGFDSRSGFSPGTAKTSVEGLAQGGKIRRDGKIVSVPLAYKIRRIDFGDGEKEAMTIPWGDVSTAYHTTGIPDIEVFIPGSPAMIANAKRANYFRRLLGIRWVQNLIKARIEKTVKGPDEAKRATMPTYVWGEATNARGERKTARIRTANGYSLTITGSLAVVNYLLQQQPEGGAYTPARLISPELVSQLPESGEMQIS
ncbi:saccharopine dehydrogenase family protein [Thalassolituus hydrocarboniclasticus]|uniref:Saccharopine dehydrogenase NADP-binding domain-containing protein n=1 Tax=Thalassolituus hydrocarboniclasticus TaxID=2742796 RepID=A0ABY6AEL9_9GAMM|nr:saccharopine dehydrogenase NADP-binding domain-containing protein [Thalassolituus hydrocarboniclasticus]UXD89252.1 saccharopine dehydrogenase NADP-binding domain-containing protein [Thalassolituus hydrocarboniclasticus]